MKKRKLHLSFDVGHSSIGWSVLETEGSVNIKGCGVVIFRADDCLANVRRVYRRQRRHIRSTRQRIARIKLLLAHLGVLKEEELNKPGCASPWKLAARVLRGGKLLVWPELWDVLRWYAHNRGYDGNRRWSAAEAEAAIEDTEKEENAKTLLDKHRVTSMAETFCAELQIDPLGSKKSSPIRFKGLNAAFPRQIVEGEVRRILEAHIGKLRNMDADLLRALLGKDVNDKTAWQAIPCPALKLPKRYQGALLFGQLVPRFDNRIISRCPVSGQKVPSRNCPEFLNFRWAMQLANIRVARAGEKELTPLTAPERKLIDSAMREQGGMEAGEFKKQVRQAAGTIRDNLDTMLMHPDAKEGLLLDPVQKRIQSSELRAIWRLLPDRLQKRTRGKLRHGRSITLGSLRDQLKEIGASVAAFDAELGRILDAANTKGRKKDKQISHEELLRKSFVVKKLDQRAGYARDLLKKAHEQVMAGKDPKENGGCLFVTEQMREALLNRELSEQTNNHLVRHRLLLLERLVRDIIKEYAEGEKSRVSKITIEVNRDLRDMSGMTAKQKAQDIGLRIANHHRVAARLEEALAGANTRITAGLIRKARIAEDLGWTCPYTRQTYEPVHLVQRNVDKDHIVPRSDRASDSLDSLVITFSAINKWKGKRTAWQFVAEEQGKTVPGMPNLSIVSLTRYKEFVEGLETFRGHEDDKRRKKRRKDLLLLPNYEERVFTPRDLTVTSQLVRLGAQALKRAFQGCDHQPVVTCLPGAVTSCLRKSWKVLGCLSLACPQVLDENAEVKKKDEIRDITHLHHALDACVLGLGAHYFPNRSLGDASLWEVIVKRNPNQNEKAALRATGFFNFDVEGRFALTELPDRLKHQIRERLSEKRVVQHIPSRMEGVRVEQNTWRVIAVKDGEATLRQSIRGADGKRPCKTTQEKAGKLLGLEPATGTGKLKNLKGALVIPDNFGVALVQPEPIIVPFHKVWTRLEALRQANGGKRPPVLRNGQIIRVPSGKNFKGIWKVFSAKNNAAGMALDIGAPDVVRLKNKTEGHKINVRLATLMKDGMELVRTPLTGVSAIPGKT